MWPASVRQFPCLGSPAYVWTWVGQNISSPLSQYRQSLQLSTMQPTPTLSPTFTFVTFLPTWVTTPASSWPGTHGYFVIPNSRVRSVTLLTRSDLIEDENFSIKL